MATNEERREIAEKVRNARTTKSTNVSFEKLTPIEFMCEIAKAIGFGKQEDGSFIDPSYLEFAYRIADLIDPTCEVHRDTVFKPAVLYPDRELDDVGRDETVFRCGKCCEIVSYDEDYNPETDSPAYCETCGSRIIGIGEPWNE